MNFLKRAWISVTQRRGKSILLLVIFAVIVNLVLAGISIQSASVKAGELARQKLGATVGLQFNTEYLRNQVQQGTGLSRLEPTTTMISTEAADLLLELDHVAAANYIRSMTVHAANFLHYGYTEEDEGEDQDANSSETSQTIGTVNVTDGFQGLQGLAIDGETRVQPIQLGSLWRIIGDIRVEGVTELTLMSEFMDDQSRMVEGRPITAEDQYTNVAVIEKRLAEFNDLAVGDVIEVRVGDEETIHELTIVGIYETDATLDAMGSPLYSPHTNPYNRIYTSYTFPAQLSASDPEGDELFLERALFYLTDPIHLDAFLAQAEEADVDWERYTLVTNDAQYQRMIGPIENISELSGSSVLIVGVAGALILGLILMLSIKDRMYEIGVLVSLGESRLKLCGQLVAEVLIIGIVAIGLSALTGQMIGQAIGDELLERELAVTEELAAQGTALPSGPTVISRGVDGSAVQGAPIGFSIAGDRTAGARVDPIDSIDVSVSAGEMLRLGLAGIVIAIGATILPAGFVLRFNPRTILTNTY